MNGTNINEATRKLLMEDLTEGGSTRRKPEKVDWLIRKADAMERLLAGTGITVDVILDSGFNSLAFVALTGDSIQIRDSRAFELIEDGTSYANVFSDENRNLVLELGYTHMTLEDYGENFGQGQARDCRSGQAPDFSSEKSQATDQEDDCIKFLETLKNELHDAACVINKNKGIVEAAFTVTDELSIGHDSRFWSLLPQLDSLNIRRERGQDITLALRIKPF